MVLSKYLNLTGILFLAHFTSIFTYTIIRKLKEESYTIPLLGIRVKPYIIPYFNYQLETWFMTIFWNMLLLMPIYCAGGIITFIAHRYGLVHFNNRAYVSVLTNMLVLHVTTILSMWLIVGERPNKNDMIALILLAGAGFFIIMPRR